MLARPLKMPISGNAAQEHLIDDVGAVVIVGANGSGKSRLGIWIEDHPPDDRETHRISAQRALTFEPNVTQRPIESARRMLLYGTERHGTSAQRASFRWGGKPTSHVLNDFDALLSLVYALERKRDSDVVKDIRGGNNHTVETIPASELDQVKKIWAEVLPHRELITTNDTVMAKVPEGDAYDGIEMSDGERVALYLMGECLCAPQNAILIIDEPEIHLHKAIEGRLWDALENARPDCTFVYITHDLDFAAGRDYSQRLWTESFDGTNWSWAEIPNDEEFPAAMVFEILGSRKPILFVEGEHDSLDKVYRSLFPRHTIVPCGSCFSVIRSVRSMSQPGIFTRHTAFGLIDRDRRSPEELNALERKGVFACPVAEVENLLVIPQILRAAAATLKAPEKADEAMAFATEQFRNEVDRLAVAFTYRSVHFDLGRFEENKCWDKDELVREFAEHVGKVDVAAIYEQQKSKLEDISAKGDFMGILKVFNRKGLVNQLAQKLGFKSDAYQTWLFGALEEERLENKTDGLLAAIQAELPPIPVA